MAVWRVIQSFAIIRTITRIGNSRGIIFDAALPELARLKEGDEVNVEVHAGGTITIVPTNRPLIEPDEAASTARRLIRKNSELFVDEWETPTLAVAAGALRRDETTAKLRALVS